MSLKEYKVDPDSWVEDQEYIKARIAEVIHALIGQSTNNREELRKALESQKYADEIMRRLRAQTL